MKPLIILSAFLLALSSCNKDMPVPDNSTDQVYTSDPGQDAADDQDQDQGQDPNDDGSDDGDGSTTGSSVHTLHMAAPRTAAH
jgi:hypothetical protein